jgi:SNF2 family DNA or RNA helicase
MYVFLHDLFGIFLFLSDIVEKALLSANHTFTRIDGSMNWEQREEAMTKFSTERCDSFETPRFILFSLMACGTGITLTRGNHVFMVRVEPTRVRIKFFCWMYIRSE